MIMALTLVGCTTKFGGSYVLSNTPPAELVSKAVYGKAPNEKSLDKTLQEWARHSLKDPDSIKYKWVRKPHKGWLTLCSSYQATVMGCHKNSFRYGHIAVIEINSKNSYGGYTGYQEFHLIFDEDLIVESYPSRMVQNYGDVY